MWGKKDETINLIISECSKLVPKKYTTRHDWVEKVIFWELFKRMNFNDLTNSTRDISGGVMVSKLD